MHPPPSNISAIILSPPYHQVIPSDYRHGSVLEDLYLADAPLCVDSNLVWSCLLPKACLSQYRKLPYYQGAWLKSCQSRKVAIAPADPTNTAAVAAATNFITYANAVSSSASKANTFTLFTSEQSFLTAINESSYSQGAGDVYSSALIIKTAYPNWEYTVRFNRTFALNGATGVGSPNTAKPVVDISVKNPGQTPSGAGMYSQTIKINRQRTLIRH